MRMNSVRMLWGKGVRAGLYPLSDTEAYWFTTKNCSSVGFRFIPWALSPFRHTIWRDFGTFVRC